MKKALLCIAIAISFVNGLSAQTCTAITYNVDLSASVDTSVIIQSTRNGDCCGGTNCIRFDLMEVMSQARENLLTRLPRSSPDVWNEADDTYIGEMRERGEGSSMGWHVLSSGIL